MKRKTYFLRPGSPPTQHLRVRLPVRLWGTLPVCCQGQNPWTPNSTLRSPSHIRVSRPVGGRTRHIGENACSAPWPGPSAGSARRECPRPGQSPHTGTRCDPRVGGGRRLLGTSPDLAAVCTLGWGGSCVHSWGGTCYGADHTQPEDSGAVSTGQFPRSLNVPARPAPSAWISLRSQASLPFSPTFRQPHLHVMAAPWASAGRSWPCPEDPWLGPMSAGPHHRTP